MHPLKLLDAAKGCKHPTIYGTKHRCCREAFDAYSSNVATVSGFAAVPGWTYWTAKTWIECGWEARQKVLGGVRMTKHQPTINKIGALADELMANKMKISETQQIEYMKEMTVMFESFVMQSPYLHKVFE